MSFLVFTTGPDELTIDRWRGYVIPSRDVTANLLSAEEAFAVVTYKSLTGLTARGFGLRDGAVPAAHWAHAKEHEFIFFGEAHGATGGVAFRLPDCADAIVSDAT